MTGESGGGQLPREEFAQRLTHLWEFAGNPTLQRVADAANQRMAAAAGPAAKKVNAQRISDWRRGRNLPAKFDAVRPVLLTVIELARKSATPAPPGLLSLEPWRQLWLKSVTWTPDSACPYRGLEAFRSGDAALFFGRDRAITDLVALVTATAQNGGGVAVLLGASGAGKSSLLAAGLIPHLGPDWTVAQGTPGPHPARSLATALDAVAVDTEAIARRLIVIDQFEELFTAGASDEERTAFLDVLRGLENDGITAILGVRADFFARCLDFPVLAEAINHRGYVLGAMGERELTDAITKPAQLSGLKLENGLADLIIAELIGLGGHDGSGTLPLLSHVMEATWNRRDGNRLTVAGYREVGGVAGSVAKTADDAWHALGPDARTAAKALMLALVTVGQDTRDTRRRIPPGELLSRATDPDAALDALESLAHARLITLDQDRAALTHEVVLDAWPQLRKWIDADRDGLLVRQRTESDAAEWVSGGRSATLLYRGDRLRRARHQQPGLSGAGREFVGAANRQRNRQLWLQSGLILTLVALLVAALAGYIDSTFTSRERDRAFFATVLSEADQLRAGDPTLSAELTALAAQSQPRDQNVVSRLIAGQTQPIATTFTDRHGLSTLTYLESGVLATVGTDGAIRLWRTDASGSIVPIGGDLTENGEHVTHLAVHGSILVSGSTEHFVRIRDLADPEHPKLLATLDAGGPVDRVAISHDGRMIAAAHDHEISVWNIAAIDRPQLVPTKLAVDGRAFILWFTVGDRALIAGSEKNVDILATADTATLWDLDPDQPVAHATTLATSNTKLQLAHDASGALVAIGDAAVVHQDSTPVDGEVSIERVDDPDHPTPVTPKFSIGSVAVLRNMAMSPDGRLLAILGPLGTTLWNLSDPTRPTTLGTPLTGRSTSCPDPTDGQACSARPFLLAFAPDGRRLTIGSEGGVIQQWSLPTSMLPVPASQALPLAVSPNGKRLLSVGSGVDAQVWDISDPTDVRLFTTVPKPDYESAFGLVPSPTISPDGNYVGLSMHGKMTLIDVSQPGKMRELHSWDSAVSMAFLPDRPIVLVVFGGLSPWVELWDYTDPEHPVRRGAPVFVQISPKLLTTGLNGATSRDGHTAVLVSDKLQVWQLSNFSVSPVGSINLNWTGEGRGIALSPDAKVVAVGWDGGTVHLFDIGDPGHIKPLGDPISVTGNTVSALDISPDGKRMAVGGADSTVRLWSFTDPEHPAPQGVSLTPLTSTAWQLAFHPKADYLFGAGDDGALRVWNLDPQAALRRICALTHTTINEDLAAHYPDQKLPTLCGR